MSHFTVAVLSYKPDDVEALLEPFDENTDNPEYLEFEVAPHSTEEIRSMFEQGKKPEESLEDFVERWYGYAYNEELDAWGFFCNPNAKWDWWQLGGRWSDKLKLKNGHQGNKGERSWTNANKPSRAGYCSQAQLKDVDFSPDQEVYEKECRFWEVVVEGDSIREGEDPKQFYTPYKRECYLEKFENKERYARSCASFSTWAIVTPDGEWHEAGTMGWFGTSDATAESIARYENEWQRIMLEADPNLWISIIDCHI